MNANALSPMVEIDFSALGVESDVLAIKELPFLGHINVRGSSENSKFMAAVKKVIGAALPIDANTFIESNGDTILWLGPNEWLIVTAQEKTLELIEKLEKALGDTFSAINDVSGGNTILELSGEKARALLSKGCPLDLHESVFTTGQCAQTVIAKTGMTLWSLQAEGKIIYTLIVRRSFSDYLGLWLLDAAREYRV
jgi:sarcosine oxidase subunit gamma